MCTALRTKNGNLEIIPKLIQAFATGFQLNSVYDSIYFRSFQEASKKINGSITTKTTETFYNEWLRLSDRNLDNELKSSSFTSLLARYINVLVELCAILRNAGYPVDYFRWLFDSFIRYITVFTSTVKDFDLSPFDTLSVKGKTRLLHYKSIIEHSQDQEPVHPVLIIYAPIGFVETIDYYSNVDYSVGIVGYTSE